MTNGRYIITINTVKSPFAAALATLMGADMLKHLLARLPNPIFFRVGIARHRLSIGDGVPSFPLFQSHPPPQNRNTHTKCACVCVCVGGVIKVRRTN